MDPNDATHKSYIKAWARMRGYVTRGLALLPTLGPHPVAPLSPAGAHDDWHRWALAVSFASSLRSGPELQSAFKKAWNYVFTDTEGFMWAGKNANTTVGGVRVAIDGLMADVAVFVGTHGAEEAKRLIAQWPESSTKALAAANRVMARS